MTSLLATAILSPKFKLFTKGLLQLVGNYLGFSTSYTSHVQTAIRVFGKILPQDAGEDNPASNLPTSFDGIATFRYPNDTALENMLAHRYYTEVVAVDEARFIDREAHNSGQVAVFISAIYDVVGNHAASGNVWNGDKAIKGYYEALFQKYDRL